MERDITGRAVQQSAKIVARVMERVTNKVPLGPSQVRLTPAEMRKEVQRMRGEPLLRMMELMGEEEVFSALRSRDNG
jgi:hypothetical protein